MIQAEHYNSNTENRLTLAEQLHQHRHQWDDPKQFEVNTASEYHEVCECSSRRSCYHSFKRRVIFKERDDVGPFAIAAAIEEFSEQQAVLCDGERVWIETERSDIDDLDTLVGWYSSPRVYLLDKLPPAPLLDVRCTRCAARFTPHSTRAECDCRDEMLAIVKDGVSPANRRSMDIVTEAHYQRHYAQ
jgi:hypothetical protein